MLRDCWWPHVAHGVIEITQDLHLLMFKCECGESLGVPLVVARDLGMTD